LGRFAQAQQYIAETSRCCSQLASHTDLSSSHPNPVQEFERIIDSLINDALTYLPDPFTLILDDLYRWFTLLWIRSSRQPGQMRLVISTRYEPPLSLARWGMWNGDGGLDLVAGNYAQANRLYHTAHGLAGSLRAHHLPGIYGDPAAYG
jgi:hypothetical protein